MADDCAAGGRPTLYTPAIATEILERLAGGESLRGICRGEGMPHESTVRLWAIEDRRGEGDSEGFAKRYATARDLGLDCIADELLDIADDGSNDWMERKREDGSKDEVVNHEHVTRSRLRVDTRKWYLAKLAPKRYGDKIEIDAQHTLDPELKSWLGQRG